MQALNNARRFPKILFTNLSVKVIKAIGFDLIVERKYLNDGLDDVRISVKTIVLNTEPFVRNKT